MVSHRRGVGPFRLQHLLSDLGDEDSHFVADPGRFAAGKDAAFDQLALEAQDGVSGRLFGELAQGPVLRLSVLRRVGIGPRHRCMDQAGPLTRPHPGGRLGGEGATGEVVSAVDLVDRQSAKALDELGYRSWRLVGRVDRYGPAVVLHQVDDRKVETAGRVQAFPELAFGGRSFPERHVGELIAPGEAACEIAPRDVNGGFGAPDGRKALTAGAA